MASLECEEYRALVEQSPTMVWRSGRDAGCDYVNGRWLAFTGRALAQELGEGWTESVHPDDAAASRALYLDHFARREAFEREHRLRRHDGAYRYVSNRGAPYHDAEGVFAGFIGSCVDVDDRRRAEAVAGGVEFFEMSLDHLCVAGFDGYLKRVNPSWTRTLGWTEEELRARPSIEFVHPDDRAMTLAARSLLTKGEPLRALTNRYRCRDGSYRWFEWRSVSDPVRGQVYAIARDLTTEREAREAREQLQRQLILADRMASVGTLAAGVAHEINNPLAYVIANLDMLAEEMRHMTAGSVAAQMAGYVEMAGDAREGAERIRKIVRGLKTFSRAEEERRTVIEVRPVLELSIDMAFNEIRHRARLVKDYGEIPRVEADDARLGQVFINLLVNAAQALPDGGAEANEIRVVTSTDALGRAVIEVRDTGGGIPEGVLGRIFEPFFTTKPVGVGTGLGLFVCHNIITSMGGEITAANLPGRGAVLRVALPGVVDRAEVGAGPTEPAEAPASRRARVLVVDDERAVGVILARVLRAHDLTCVTTAREALDLLLSDESFDVILSDLMMPTMSGMDLYDELARLRPEAAERMVFITGGAFTQAAVAFLERVPNERIEKPFTAAAVRALVQRFVP
ncbi:MAG: PAS domain S-box protein [Deltaproteobacteria bacterium]|nr:PAS domain S-box protein [Deltaproteobacteria bacterium]